MNQMDNCIFCKIIKRELPSNVIYEDDTTISFLDISPANKGHALVISKNHFTNIFDVPGLEFINLSKTVHTIAKAIKEATKADGLNIFLNNEKAAGQIVFHIHYHIIPRYNTDGIQFKWPNKKYEHNESIDYCERIKKCLVK